MGEKRLEEFMGSLLAVCACCCNYRRLLRKKKAPAFGLTERGGADPLGGGQALKGKKKVGENGKTVVSEALRSARSKKASSRLIREKKRWR